MKNDHNNETILIVNKDLQYYFDMNVYLELISYYNSVDQCTTG